MKLLKSNEKMKIAIITNIPTPYRRKQWECYSKCKYLDISIFYCAKTEKERYWDVYRSEGVKEIFLNGINYGDFHFNPGILKILFQDFDLYFVGGYGFPTVVISIFILNILNKPWVLIFDGISPLELKRDNSILRKFLIKGAISYFANGTVSKKYLEKNGIPRKKIFNQFMTVDVDYLIQKRKDLTKVRREIRLKYKISTDSVVVIYSGRLVRNKGVQDLIEVVRNLKNQGYNIKSLIVGDGNYMQNLKRLSQDIQSDIIFTGYINPEELYNYYYASDLFVLPTHNDAWGLVVNEAMACGLPVIVTDAAGCSIDLIKNNGFVIEAGNLKQMYYTIEKIIKNDLFEEYGKNSIEIISKWTYKESYQSFLDVITDQY